MKNKKIIITVIAAISVILAVSITAIAGNFGIGKITCPECGAEIELERPEKGPKGMSLETLKTELAAKVEAGEMTQEEMDAKIAEYEKRIAEREAKKAEMDEKIANGELPEMPENRGMGRGRGFRMSAPKADNADE